MSPAERARDRQRRACEALFGAAHGIDVYMFIARALAEGADCRGAGIAHCSPDRSHLFFLGAWFDDAPCSPPTMLLDSTYSEIQLSHDGGETTVLCGGQFPCALPAPFNALPRAAWCGIPLRDEDGTVIGLLFTVADTAATNDPDELSLLKLAAARTRSELQHQRSAEALSASEARMRLALETGALGMWEWDLERHRWIVNERWTEMRGYRPGEITPEFADWHPDDEADLRPLHDAAMSGKIDAYEIDYRTTTRTGWRWINARTSVIKRDANGKPLRIVGVQTDIHERRLAEEAARANQQWLALAVDATGLGLWDWDAATDRIAWSSRCASMLGYALEEMPATSMAWIPLNHVDDQAEAARQFVAHLRGEIPEIRVEIRCRAKDGQWRWILSHGRVIARDPHGRARRAVGTHQDITEIKSAAETVRASEARLRLVFDHAPVGIFLADAQGRLVYCNPAILRLPGDNPGWSGARPPHEYDWLPLVHADDRARVAAAWQRFVAQPDEVYDVEWRADIPSGERRLQVRAAAIWDQGCIQGFAGAIEDVTEQRAVEEREKRLAIQLQQSQKVEAVGRLTGGIAHDFNNSLAAVIGFTSLAQQPSVPADKLESYLDTVMQAAEHSRDLVRKLLDFSRRSPTEDVSPLDAAAGIREATRMLQAMIPSTVRMSLCIDETAPPVLVESTGLQQILFNLVLNASDAIDGHGEVQVALEGPRRYSGECIGCHRSFDDSYVTIAVRDSGCGIAPGSIASIFEPFYSTKEIGHGTGMGLAVLDGIVHRAGGHVVVSSVPGSGTTMRVLLRPGETQARFACTTEPGAAPTAREASLRVLVVDDEPTLVDLLCEWLDTQGHQGIPFTDPADALAWARLSDARYDVLLTDQTMPAMTGTELARALRLVRPELPVLICTGLADRVNADEARALGIEQLYFKPVPLDELQTALRRAGNPASSRGAA